MKVFVLSPAKTPLMSTTPGRARRWLKQGRARVIIVSLLPSNYCLRPRLIPRPLPWAWIPARRSWGLPL